MKKLHFSGLPVLAAVVLMCGLLTACVQPPVGGQTESTPPPVENTAPIEDTDPIESTTPLESADPVESAVPIESTTPVENTEKPVDSITAEDLALSEDGHLTSDSATAANLQAALDGYFAARISAINKPDAASPTSVSSGNTVSSAAIARADAIRAFWLEEGVYIISEETSFEIRKIASGELPGTVDLTVYEWSWMNYNEVGVDAPATDRSGSGIYHDITLSPNTDGTFSVTRDSYEETGYSSPDYDGVKGSQW